MKWVIWYQPKDGHENGWLFGALNGQSEYRVFGSKENADATCQDFGRGCPEWTYEVRPHPEKK